MNNSWGPITWYVFHGLAEKIKEDLFYENKAQMIALIRAICNNIPCPECREHAKFTLQKLKIETINTKEDFQKFLWSFHNIINKKRGIEIFTFDDCKKKYEKINLDKTVRSFILLWSKNLNIVRLMSDSLHRNLFLDKFSKWYLENRDKFDS